MFIGKLSNVLPNPEGIICKNRANLHIIPSGLNKILPFFPINIYSLRECRTNLMCDINPIISNFQLTKGTPSV